ncbi:HAD-IIA family hydrolase [Nitratiruptor tergarcus]|uniref:NagD protein n=1 Tax=Nitratiruptor tergarcus DSM 16512 TaxID=1069081 RepID=A0A1W1WS86_9BACT|nr:HAD-IIA family hydrolase [Nitratiruptor tergarcus]SMC09062.1 NagD protein [Nitratiruptor tergarcus DSM 16512]
MKLFIDVQGTLIDDKDKLPIKGAVTFIDLLNKKEIPYIIITNNTKRADFLEYLRSLGFAIKKDAYIDPLMVLQEVLQAKKVAAYGVEGFLDVLKAKGYILEYEAPEAVVLSVKDNYTFDEFAQIDEFLLRGAALYGMHQTSIYAKGDKRYPGVGALLEMFHFATGAKYSVVGKPSRLFFQKALQRIGAKDFSEITIISDDVQGDLLGAHQLGMQTVFVLSGKFKNAEEILPKLDFKPDFICKDIGEAAQCLGVDHG